MKHAKGFAHGFQAPSASLINMLGFTHLSSAHDLILRSFNSHDPTKWTVVGEVFLPLQNGEGKSHCAPLPGDTMQVRMLWPSSTKPDSQLYLILSPMLYREPWLTPFGMRPGVPHVWLGRTERSEKETAVSITNNNVKLHFLFIYM